jgi:hypothetical protein
MITKRKCKGIKEYNKSCPRNTIEDHDFCEPHLFLEKYIEDDRKRFSDVCGRCKILFKKTDSKYCPHCREANIKQNVEQKTKTSKPYCSWFKKGTKEHCAFHVDKVDELCKIHKYVENYTKEQRDNVKECKGCCLWKYWDFDTHSLCHDCQHRSKTNNTERKEKRCEMQKCTYCNNVAIENGCCGKHQREFQHDDNIKNGIRCCSNFMRCANTLSREYEGMTCQQCRDKDKEVSKEKRDTIDKYNEQHKNEEGYKRKCKECGKDIEKDVYYSNKKLSPKCEECFMKQQNIEKQRKKRARDWRMIYEKCKNDPRYIERKTKWKNEHLDRVAMYTKNYRKRLIENIGIDEYHLRMAERMRNYWSKNPEKRCEFNDNEKRNSKKKYTNCINSAKYRKIDWDNNMTFGKCESLFKGRCHYCGQKYEEGGYLLGIDRVDNNIGYTLDNVVTCCGICNYMKWTYSKDTFLHICEYMLGKLGIVNNYDDDYKKDMMESVNMQTYRKYVKCAESRGIKFEMDEEDFEMIISQKCYICGSESYNNGIDRIDSDGTYNINNCKSCCRTCNYFKRDLDIYDFLTHLILIVDFSTYDNFLNIDETLEASKYNSMRNDHAIDTLHEKCNVEELCSPYEVCFASDNGVIESEKVENDRDPKNIRKRHMREQKRASRSKIDDEKRKFMQRRDSANARGKKVGIDVDENYFAIKKV